MYDVSAQGVDDRMINVHYYYYPLSYKCSGGVIITTGIEKARHDSYKTHICRYSDAEVAICIPSACGGDTLVTDSTEDKKVRHDSYKIHTDSSMLTLK